MRDPARIPEPHGLISAADKLRVGPSGDKAAVTSGSFVAGAPKQRGGRLCVPPISRSQGTLRRIGVSPSGRGRAIDEATMSAKTLNDSQLGHPKCAP